MNGFYKGIGAVGKLLWLLPTFFFLFPVTTLAATEETFDVLQTRTATYTNVTVTKKTGEWIFILHSSGMINIKVEELSPEIRDQLGYGAKAAKNKTAVAEMFSSVPLPQLKDLGQQWEEKGAVEMSHITDNPHVYFPILGALLLMYVFYANCCRLICRKAHHTAGPLVWIPVLQLIPLLRAAGMSRLWFFAFFVPILNLIASILWAVKIVKARGKSGMVALFLIFPFTGLFAFFYLAFSSDAPVVIKPEYQSMALETA